MSTGKTFQFTTVSPSLDLRKQRGMISKGLLSRAVGVDGRFTGSCRRFPGFIRLATFTSFAGNAYSSIYDFQAVSLQKGNTDEYIRGFVIYGYDGSSNTIVFHYYDTNGTPAWAKVNIATGLTASEEVSFAENGKVLYCFREGAAALSVLWTGAVDTGSVVVKNMGPGDFGSAAMTAPTAVVYDDGAGPPANNYSGVLTAGTYQIAVRYKDTDRGVYSGVSPLTEVVLSSDSTAIKVSVSEVAATTNIEDFDTVEVFRTISTEIASTSYDGGILYKCGEAILSDGGANWTAEYIIGLDTGGATLPLTLPTYYDELKNEQIVLQTIVDPIAEYAASPPQTGVVGVYQGVTFAGGTKGATAGTVTDAGRTRLQWSPLTSYNPENFPPVNSVYLDSVTEQVVAFRKAGDVLFGLSPSKVQMIQRAGSQISIHSLHTGRGPVNKRAIAAVDNDLFYVSQSEVLYMNASSGSLTSMSAVDRVIQEYWADSLDAVSCAFDPALGATIMFNSTEEEAYLTWSTNNSITQLGDLTFKFVTSGVMPTATGNGLNALSSFFIDDTGRVYYPNSKASTSGQKLTTLGLNGDVRGTCEVDGTTVTLDTATSDANAIGGYIYIADDNSATYERVKITNNPTPSTYTIASTINATNGTFELSPVPMRIRYWPISWPREENSVIESYPRFLFRRMLGKSFGIVAYNSSLPSGSEAVVGYYRNYSNTIEYPKLCGLTDNPADNYAYSNADGVSLEPGLDLFVSGGIIEIVAVEVDIEWKDSRKAN